MSHNAIVLKMANMTDGGLPRFSSQILAEEMEGYNLVASMIPDDIFTTIQAINSSFAAPIYVQTKHPADNQGHEGGVLETFLERFEAVFGFYTMLEYHVKSKLVLDNFYGYSLNRTLLEMPVDQLRQIPGLKVRYLQVDIKNKCVPIDWFIGYDTFSIYSFINLLGFGKHGTGGYLKTILRGE